MQGSSEDHLKGYKTFSGHCKNGLWGLFLNLAKPVVCPLKLEKGQDRETSLQVHDTLICKTLILTYKCLILSYLPRKYC